MVWINYSHSNNPVPTGVFGGSICMCEYCCKKREPESEKTSVEIMREDMLPKHKLENDL